MIYQSQIAMSTGFLEETWTRNLLNLMVTPLREVEYVAGVALFGMVKLVLGCRRDGARRARVLLVPHVVARASGLIPIAAVLLVVGWAISLFVIGLVLRFGTGAEALAWGVMFVLLPLSGVFYPTDALPAFCDRSPTAADDARVRRAARLVDRRPLNWAQVGIAGDRIGRAARARVGFLVQMLKTFRRRGYITRYT